jgi:hypothetical protein
MKFFIFNILIRRYKTTYQHAIIVAATQLANAKPHMIVQAASPLQAANAIFIHLSYEPPPNLAF